MEYVAFKMSSDFKEGGFKTKDEAWEYIYSRDCENCKRLKEENNPQGYACSAEWSVATRKQIDKWTLKEEECIIHNTDFNGKCFKCGEQVFIKN